MATVALVLCKDTSRILAILFMFVFVISADRHNLNNFGWVIGVSLGLLFVGIIFHIIHFKPRFISLFKERKIKGFTLATLLLIFPMVLGGIGRGDRNIGVILLVLALMLVISVCYLFFLATTEDKNPEAIIKLMVLVMFVSGLVITSQMIVYYIRLGSFESILDSVYHKSINVGWAGPNNVSPMLALCLPSSFYYAIKKRNYGYWFIIIACIQYVLILSTLSRGTILFTTLALPFMLCYTMAKSENKLGTGLVLSLCCAAGIALMAYYGPQLLDIINRMIGRGLDDSGRIELYKDALQVFKKYPLFGAGWDYRLGEMAGDGYTPYWYHSTPFQILANMGIVGAVFFSLFSFWRYKNAFFTKKYRVAKYTIGAGLLLFELYGFVDVNYFGPTFFISMLIMSFAIDKSLTIQSTKTLEKKNNY
ncbi:MAG: O-antigen ligase family protein [Bacillota bacterium]